VFGAQLTSAAHMGPEVHLYWNALNQLMHTFNPDFRQLISNSIFSSREHFQRMGIINQVPGIVDWPQDAEQASSIREAVHLCSAWADPASHAIGVHWASLLLCVSLSGDAVIHPKMSSNFARNILCEILKHSPQSATPG